MEEASSSISLSEADVDDDSRQTKAISDASLTTTIEADNTHNNLNDWEYAKKGIELWLNNNPYGAEKYFEAKKDNTKVYAAFTFTTVMNAVISYELDKIELAQSMLNDLETRCSTENGWIQSMKSRIFGSRETLCKPLKDNLEEKIILADCLMCSAILTFLTQDISGLMKGSWLLRKAWKIYQQTYTQIFEIYKTIEKTSDETHKNNQPSTISDNNESSGPISPLGTDSDLSSLDENIFPIPPILSIQPPSPTSESSSMNYCRQSMVRSKTTNVIASRPSTNSNNNNRSSSNILRKSLHQIQSEGSSTARNVISHLPKKLPSKLHFEKLTSNNKLEKTTNHHSTAETAIEIKSSLTDSNINQKFTSHPSKNNLTLDLKANHHTTQKNGFIRQVPLSCPEPLSTPLFTKMPPFDLSDINLQLIKRLMGAVSFGYGLFQLSISLLPPSLLRFISFFGFEGNKNHGISCLTYCNQSDDMRAPLARLVLLWYYTIGAQLFHIDGANMENEIIAAKQLLKESQVDYAKSAIFLFFRARIKRLQCNTNTAIDLYDAAYRMSAQKELKLLCLHEVGWCRLIELDFGNAMLHFHELRLASNFSKSFYTYMTTICQGAFGRFDNIIKLRNELIEILNRYKHRETLIDRFISRRIDKLPSDEKDHKDMFNVQYFKFFIYEMLFLWNTLYSCSKDVLDTIILDCSKSNEINTISSNTMENFIEPTIGLSDLILGSCQAHLEHITDAIISFRQCIQKREGLTEDLHVSAFAHYELAILLIKDQQNEFSKQEAKIFLTNAQRYFKNYDFESRLSARIYSTLKNLQ